MRRIRQWHGWVAVLFGVTMAACGEQAASRTLEIPATPTSIHSQTGAEGVLWTEATDTSGKRAIYLLDISQQTFKPFMTFPDNQHGSSLSPDGSYVAVQEWDADGQSQHITLIDLETGTEEAITQGIDVVSAPVWSPDGKYLYFRSGPPIVSDIQRVNVDTGELESIVHSDYADACPTPSADGHQIAFTSEQMNVRQVFLLSLSDGELHPLTDDPDTTTRCAAWSPIDDTLALLVEANGVLNLATAQVSDTTIKYVTNYDSTDTQLFPPIWSPDGEFLAYNIEDDGLYSIYTYDLTRDEHRLVITIDKLITLNQWLRNIDLPTD